MEERWILGPIRVALAEHAGPRRGDLARRHGDRLLADLTRELTGEPARIGRRCPTCGATNHGRPVAAGGGLWLSVGYADGAVAVAAAGARTVGALGVDVESGAGDAAAIPGLSLQDWTRVEAAMKADGRGALVDPARAVLGADLVLLDQWTTPLTTIVLRHARYQLAIAFRLTPEKP